MHVLTCLRTVLSFNSWGIIFYFGMPDKQAPRCRDHMCFKWIIWPWLVRPPLFHWRWIVSRYVLYLPRLSPQSPFFGMVTVVFNTSTSILKTQFSFVTSHRIHGKSITGKAVCSFHFHIVSRFNILHFQDAWMTNCMVHVLLFLYH